MVNLDDDKKPDGDVEPGANEEGGEDPEEIDSWELEEDLE